MRLILIFGRGSPMDAADTLQGGYWTASACALPRMSTHCCLKVVKLMWTDLVHFS